jgi:outer membrane autotransporter protein
MLKKKLIYTHIALALSVASGTAYSACSASGTTLTCTNAAAIWANNSSGFDIRNYEKIIISTTAEANISGPSGWAVYSAGNPMTFKDLDITTAGAKADGIVTKNGTTTINVDKLKVITSGSSADGINLGKESNNTTITVGNNAYIDAKGMGVRANTSATTAGENLITVGNGATIISRDPGNNIEFLGRELGSGYTVYAGNTNSSAVGNARVVIGDGSTLTSYGTNAHVVYANKGGVIELGNTNITANANGAHGIFAEAGSKSGGTVGSQVYLLGNTQVTIADGSKYAIYAKGVNSQVSSYNQHTGQTTSGIFNVNGNMRAEAGGKIDLIMNNGSDFIGNTSLSGTGSVLNLKIDGSASRWEMNADSTVTTLDLTNGANVWFTDHSTAVTDTDYTTLTVQDLKGTGGVFHMRTGLDGSHSSTSTSVGDLLVVTGTSQGHHLIKVNDNNSGAATTDGSEMQRMVVTNDGNATFGLNHTGNAVDIGAYQYELVRGDSLTRMTTNNWWLKSRASRISDPANNSTNILNINYLLSNVENQTLLQRMGEIRRNDSNHGDFWIRSYVGKLSSFEDSALRGFDMSYDGVQMGADKYLGNNTYFGIMMGTAKADVDYEVGDGTTKSHHLGLYGTFKTQSGWYVDAIAKYVHMDNKFNTVTSGGYTVEGHAGTNGYSAGLEVGKRFFLQTDNAGWYVEPQAQFTYSHQDSAVVKATNGLKTSLGEFDSMIGRVSGIVGYTVSGGENPIDIYLKTGYVKEFDGKTSYTFNDTVHNKYKFNGNWWDNGIGVSAQIKNQHNIYLEADYSRGDKFDKKQVNLGYRYAF